ncbi:MAG: hypothetical protein JKY70_01350 [Mucilaginibacter sp.]|nr:hypothetical protein [Mucilaginibacter sp.]
MKHLFLLAVLGLLLSACTKKTSDTPDPNANNDEATNYPQLIAAKWQQTADTVQYMENDKITNTSVDSASGLYYQFNADGTGKQTKGSDNSDITFILNERNIIITNPPTAPEQEPIIMPGTIRLLNATTLCMYFDDINVNGASKSTQVIWFKKVG